MIIISTKTCDGCAGPIPQGEDLTCSCCHLSLHRYCAGIPRTHYADASLNFVCIACTQKAGDATVRELKGEIASLKAEILVLKSALTEMNRTAEQAPDSQNAVTPTVDEAWVTVSRQPRKPNTERQQRYPRRPKRHQQSATVAGRNEESSNERIQTTNRRDNLGGRDRTPQAGARKIWGTLKSTTARAVERAISTIAKIPFKDFSVKRKFKNIQGDHNRRRIARWWFVVRAEESILQELTESWNAIAIQTNWKLEPLLVFADEIQPQQNCSNADDEAQLTHINQEESGTNADDEAQPTQINQEESNTSASSSTAEILTSQDISDSQSTSFLGHQ